MSCNVVVNKTISAIVSALIAAKRVHKNEAQAFGDLMASSNAQSVNACCGDDAAPAAYIFEPAELVGEEHMIAIQMLTNIAFFNYQTTEMPDYQSSLVWNTLEGLRIDLLSYYKAFCVQWGYHTAGSIAPLEYHELPFNEGCTWGLQA